MILGYTPLSPMDTYLDYVWIDFPKRTVKIQDNEGRIETVQWKWDEEGAEGFHETVELIQESVPAEQRCYLL